MSNIHNNWRKFLTEGSYNESKLLQEVSEEELEYIQTAVDEMAPEDLAFNELFGGKERVLIPFSTMDDSTELGQFLTILGKFRGNDLDISFDYVPNWEKGVMEKERSVSSKELNNMLMGGEDPKRVLQTMKIGKYLAASERAISEYAKWIKYKDDNDLGSGSRPMTTDEMEKEQKIRDKVRQIVGVSHPNDLMVRFLTRRDGVRAERLQDIVTKIQGLKQYWQKNADYIKKNPTGELSSDTYSIIITRNPIDVLRMSDFRNITSCHSPTSRGSNSESYFKCAVAEAHGEGAVAYVVRNGDLEELFDEDPKNINLDAFEQEEIFHDDFRFIAESDLLNPVSRVRLRLIRYYEDNTPLGKRMPAGFFATDTGVDIAVPEERVYGKRIPGLREAIMNWAKANQSAVLDKIMSQKGTLDLEKFTAFGGSYEDNRREELLIKMLGITQADSPLSVQVTTGRIDVNTTTEDNLEGIGPESDAQQLETEAERLIENARLDEFQVLVSAEFDEENAWLDPDVTLRLEWPADEWKGLPNNDLLRYIPDELEAYGSEYSFLSDRSPSIMNIDGKIIMQWNCDTSKLHDEEMYSFYDADGFESFLEELEVMERGGGTVDVIKSLIETFMKREGYIDGGAIISLGQEVESGAISSYEWDWNVDEGYDDTPIEAISAEAYIRLPHGDIPEEVVKKIFSTRDFWLDIRKRMHAPIHQAHVASRGKDANKYYVDIEKFISPFDGEESAFKLNYSVDFDNPDDTVEIFQQMIEHWDDEDLLHGLFNTVIKEYAAKITDLTPMKDPESDMNRDELYKESKKVTGQKLFNNWRNFLEN